MAYSSLSSFPFSLQPHEDPIIRHIANTKHNSDDDQGNDHKEAIVVLRWILQQGIAVIPRTAKLDKLASNMQAGGVYLFLILFLIIVYRNHIYIYIYIYIHMYIYAHIYACANNDLLTCVHVYLYLLVSPWCALGEEEMKIITSISHLTGSPISVPVVY